MPYLIDTNIAIHARDGDAQVLAKFTEHAGATMLSSLSLAEMQRGLYKNPDLFAARARRLDALLRAVRVLPFDAPAALAYGQIIAACGWSKGRDFDRMIAAHAIASRATFVTDNVADFHDIPGLAIENWLREP
ncbi:MAG: type II toxin-antitoxin system VapC family toxin [Beijerinckiaceae bacterium]